MSSILTNLSRTLRSFFPRRRLANPRQARKKIEINLRELGQQLYIQSREIQTLLENEMLPASKAELAKSILAMYFVLEESQIDKANVVRLEYYSENLLDPEDFAVYLAGEMEALLEEMKSFMKAI